MKKDSKIKALLGRPLTQPTGNGYHKDRRTKREQNRLQKEMNRYEDK